MEGQNCANQLVSQHLHADKLAQPSSISEWEGIVCKISEQQERKGLYKTQNKLFILHFVPREQCSVAV